MCRVTLWGNVSLMGESVTWCLLHDGCQNRLNAYVACNTLYKTDALPFIHTGVVITLYLKGDYPTLLVIGNNQYGGLSTSHTLMSG